MDDFEPEQVARQVKPLRDLLDLRTKLSDLRAACKATRSWSGCSRKCSATGQDGAVKRELREQDGVEGVAWPIGKQRKPPRQAAARHNRPTKSLLDQIVSRGPSGKDDSAGKRGRGPDLAVRRPGAGGQMTVTLRISRR